MLNQASRRRAPHPGYALIVPLAFLLPAAEARAQASASVPAVREAVPRPVRPGDQIRLSIWREPEMSGEYQVDEAGVVVFPRLGEVRVVEHSAASLRAYLLEEYRRYLRNPSIDVVVLRRVRISGAVRNPGLYPVDPTISLADALALAGGPTPQGNQSEVRILRDGAELTTAVNENTIIAESPIRSGDVILVPQRSWFGRNVGVIAATIGAAASLVFAFTAIR